MEVAEFCLDCWNKINHTKLTEEDIIIDDEMDLCEGCGELKYVIIKYRKKNTNFFGWD